MPIALDQKGKGVASRQLQRSCLKGRPTCNPLSSRSLAQAAPASAKTMDVPQASSEAGRTPAPTFPTDKSAPIHCFTDGAAQGNGRKGCKGGLGVVFPAQPNLNLSEV